VAVFHGTKHDDTFNESSDTASDTFDLAKGGEDTATGGSGDDVFNMGASLDAGDRLDGGAGRDVVNIHGDYSAGLVFDDQTIQNIEVLRLGAGFDYSLTMANGNVASGAYLTIDASALGRANHLTFDGSLESDGHYLITDGAGDDVLTGGALADKFRLMNGGTDTVHGGGGDDVIVVTAGSPTGDTIDGGTGNDTLILGGHSGSVTLDGSDNVTGIETLSFQAGNSYAVTVVSDITDGGGKTLTVDGSALGASDTMTIDLSGATSAAYAIHGGAGGDTVTFGSNFANANGGFGTTDTIDGGAGSDTLIFTGGLGSVGLLVAPPLEMDSGTLTSVETIDLQGTDNFHIQLDNGNIAVGATLTIDSTGTTGKVQIDASAVADGSLHFIAGAGQTGLIGGANADVFDLTQATNADAEGGGGNDVFNLAGSLAGMIIEGDAGNDTLTFNADVTSLAIAQASVFEVETLKFLGGHSYTGVAVTGDVASGSTLTVDASAASNISIDLTAATSVAYVVTGSAGDDTIKGANAATTFHLEAGGNDTVTGGSGNDVFDMGGALTAADTINGGAGTNTLVLDGDYSAGLTFGAATVTNVETIDLTAGHDYNITLNAATASSFGLTVDGSNLGAGDSLTIDASAVGRHLTLIGGAGDDVLTGGTARSTFDISQGGDDIVHSIGLDSVRAGAAFTAADTIFGSGFTGLELNGDYSAGVTTTNVTGVNNIQVDQGHSYDITLAAATVTAGHELSVHSNSGNFDGSDSLIVDASQVAGNVTMDSDFASCVLTGGSGDDTLAADYVGESANTLNGGGGDDVLNLSGFQIGADDFADGGTGNDTLDVSLFGLLSSSNVTHIDSVRVQGNGDLDGAITGDITGGKGVLTIEIDNLFSLHLDLSAATSAGYVISMPGTGPGTFVFAGNFLTSDVVDGGGSDDTLELNGDYSAGLTFGATTIADIDTIKLDDGFSYKLTMNANDTAGNTQTIDATALGAAHTLTFDGSAEANSILVEFGAGFTAADSVIGGSGSDTLQFNGDYASLALSTAQASSIETLKFLGNHSYTGVTVTGDIADGSTLTIDASAASNLSIDLGAATSAAYAITGSGGNDMIKFAGNFSASDSVNGGAGNDTLSFNGDYSGGTTFGASQLTSIETIVVADGHTYTFTTNDGNVAAGATLTVDGSALTGSNQLFFNGSAETNGHFAFIGGASDDDLEGGAQSDTFDLSRSDGAFAFGNGGNDTFTVTSAAKFLDDSIDGGAGSDTLILNGDFSTQTAITLSNVENIEALTLQGTANGYNLVLGGGGVEGAGTFTIDAGAAASLVIDVSGATSSAYVITGSAGADTFKFGSNFSAADAVDGGAGSDTLILNGDYSAGLTFGASTITSIETLKLSGGSYDIVTNNSNVGPGDTLAVDATALTTAQTLAFDGSAESNGNFVFEFGANFTASDTITGGAGDDTLSVSNGGGSLSLTLSSTAVTSVETLQLFSHNITNASITGDIADGSTLNIDSTSARLSLDLSAATSSGYDLDITSPSSSNVTFGGNFAASDIVHGDKTTLILDGDYSGGLALSGTKLSGINTVDLTGAFSYTVSAIGDLDSGHTNTIFTAPGAANTDFIDLTQGTATYEVIDNGAGSMTVKFAGNFNSNEFIGGGNTTVELDGDYSAGLNFVTTPAGTGSHIDTLSGVALLKLDDGFSYKLAMDEDNDGRGMTVDASALSGGHTLNFDGSGDSQSLTITGGAAGDTIIGSTVADTITGGLGADTLTGGGGNDTFNFASAGDSNTTTGYDTITDLTSSDSIHIAGATPTFFASETVSAYQGSLDADLASALSGMGAGKYAVVTLTGAGDPLDGHTFLVVDGNGTAGYTAGADYVIDITGYGGDAAAIHFI